MDINDLPTDKIPEKNVKALKLIRQQELNVKRLAETSQIQVKKEDVMTHTSLLSTIEEEYKKKEKNLFTKHCTTCKHRCPMSSYCNLKKEIIYDEELHAFCCDSYHKVRVREI